MCIYQEAEGEWQSSFCFLFSRLKEGVCNWIYVFVCLFVSTLASTVFKFVLNFCDGRCRGWFNFGENLFKVTPLVKISKKKKLYYPQFFLNSLQTSEYTSAWWTWVARLAKHLTLAFTVRAQGQSSYWKKKEVKKPYWVISQVFPSL